METNNIDTKIKEKLQNRTFTPSNSAWERLSVQLEEQPNQKNKSWMFYAGIAASILILITIGFGMFSSEENQFLPKDEIVISPIDTAFIESKLKELKIETEVKEAVVEIDETEVEKKKFIKQNKKVVTKNQSKLIKLKENKVVIAKVEEVLKPIIQKDFQDKIIKKTSNKVVSNSSIKVNSDDLLFAVTHTEEEVLTYYAKNNINRKKLLESIEKQLKKSNVKINANSILAEVEQNINEDTFKNNFLQMIKKKVSDVASAVASRNN